MAEVQRSGLSNLSFRSLADLVGVKSASVHYHFPEKSDLAKAILTQYAQDYEQELERIASRRRDPVKKLNDLVDIFEHVLSEDKFCLCGMLAAEVTTLDDESRALIDSFFTNTERWIEEVLVQDAEQVTSNLPHSQLAQLITSGLEGALLIDRIGQRPRYIKAQRAWIASLFN